MTYALELFIPTADGYHRTVATFASLEEALTTAEADIAKLPKPGTLARLMVSRDHREPYFRLYDADHLVSDELTSAAD